MRFSEKVAIITGAGNGIGKATGEIIVGEGGGHVSRRARPDDLEPLRYDRVALRVAQLPN